jgi:hypothetical protein
MQRFKEHIVAKHGADEFSQVPIQADNTTRKFVYGANGTLTQAARWRIQAIERAGNIACVCYNSKDQRAHLIRLQVSCIRSLLQSAREGGCYLP